MTVTKDQAQMLATLARACRPNGAATWDTGGIMAALATLHDRQLAEVIMATIRAATDRDCETPAVIPKPGSHWRETTAVRAFVPQTIDPAHRCGICSMHRDKCRQLWADDHDFDDGKRDPVDVPRTVAALKDTLVPVAPPAPRKTLDDLTRDPRVQALRAALPALVGPAMRDESEPPVVAEMEDA